MYVTKIGHAVLEVFHFEVDILRKGPKFSVTRNVNIKSAEQYNSWRP